MPPRPGIRFPESFTLQERLNTDSIKSPIIAKIDVMKVIKKIAKFEILLKYWLNNGIKRVTKKTTIKVPKIPPRKPTILLLGLAFTKPRLFLPNNIPKNQAKESVPKTTIKIKP